MIGIMTGVYVCFSHSVVFNSVWPNGLQPARLLFPWGFSRQEYWHGLPFLLQGISPPWSLGLLHRRLTLSQLSHQGSPLDQLTICDSFRWTAKGLSHIDICIHSLPNSPPIQAATQHWAEFLVLYSTGPTLKSWNSQDRTIMVFKATR